jgi:hypothetical protein
VLYAALTIQILVGGLFLLLVILIGLFSPFMCDNGCSNETALTASSLLVVPAVTALVCITLCVTTALLWRKLSGGRAIITAVAMTIAYPLTLYVILWVLGTIIFYLFDGS